MLKILLTILMITILTTKIRDFSILWQESLIAINNNGNS